MNGPLETINGGSLKYELGDKKFDVPIDGIAVQKCSNDDIQPHLLRMETIELLNYLINSHSTNFDAARDHLL
jgi:hypothetical protein